MPEIVSGLTDTEDARRLWSYYFADELPANDHVSLWMELSRYVACSAAQEHTPERLLKNKHGAHVHYEPLVAMCPMLPMRLEQHPQLVLSMLSFAVHRAVLSHPTLPAVGTRDVNCTRKRVLGSCVHARLIGWPTLTPLKDLRSPNIGKYVCIRGNVVRVSNMRPQTQALEFQCARCREKQTVHLVEGRYEAPSVCTAQSCRAKVLVLSRSTARMVDWQKIRVQELPSEDAAEAGRVPRSVDVEFTADLVDACVPGDTVTVGGIIKAESVEDQQGAAGGRRSTKQQKTIWVLYVDANSVSKAKSADAGTLAPDATPGGNTQVGDAHSAHFTTTDLHAIREIKAEPDVFKLVVNSLSPGIYGHHLVKAGIALSLFGGTPRTSRSRGGRSRSDPHMLIVGDPGMGKSQMLNYLTGVTPRGVYVCGNTTSATGLTVTVVRDAASGEFVLEAGALVLADRGVCCIDEFDKMSSAEHQALLEAMEQQHISVAKAGIVCSLPARASVIAAANPVGGHYNRAKTVAENLRMSAPILSRFDLVFILVDSPDVLKDRMMSRHVMALHRSRGPQGQQNPVAATPASTPANTSSGYLDWDRTRPLSERLQVTTPEFDPLPAKLLRKYIEYARMYIRPELTDRACTLLKEFYLHLRRTHSSSECGTITTRQLESLMRLAEARAKLELSEVVTEAHVQDVIDIMKESLFYDTMADLGADLATAGYCHAQGRGRSAGDTHNGSSKKALTVRLCRELELVAEQKRDALLTTDEVREAYTVLTGGDMSRFDVVLDDLNIKSYLLKKGPGKWQVASSAYALSSSQRVV